MNDVSAVPQKEFEVSTKPKTRFHKRPLLVAGVGAAMISIAACGGFTSGNLMAPRCPDGGVDTDGTACKQPDAGTVDGGVPDGGTGGDR